MFSGRNFLGRSTPVSVPKYHYVNGNPLNDPLPDHLEKIAFGMGCFWGTERIFWETKGVFVTAAGYAAGKTPHPSYEEVCSGLTGHNEVVLVTFEPRKICIEMLLKVFWESHDPTQGMRQGNDIGDQYRSGIYYSTKMQLEAARKSMEAYQNCLNNAGWAKITTEIKALSNFYFAEDYHQQYLGKNPDGYCGLGGTGVSINVC